jgi:phytoene dehydrogenase-like protein
MNYDVAIVGAGMSGLAAAIRLAHFGKKVCIFERHSVWGGLNSFYKKGGHHFDVGLHAVTNYIKSDYKGARVPLQLISRQLRIPIDAFALRPQNYSQTAFESLSLNWENGLSRISDEISRLFPDQIDGFVKLEAACLNYPPALQQRDFVSTRQHITEYLTDPVLIDMLLCPLLYYGSAVEDDVDFGQFMTLFNSIYREGFGRPDKGVKHILNLLLSRLKKSPKDLGLDTTITFFNHTDRFRWRPPEDYVDFNSGVLCAPDNYLWDEPPVEHHLRVTHLANWKKWFALSSQDYQAKKEELIGESKKSIARFVGDFSDELTYVDGFSPTTVKKFTGHLRGAIYGAPAKSTDGRTDVENLFLCGTDQGMLGIIGAMVSGVAVANTYGMVP